MPVSLPVHHIALPSHAWHTLIIALLLRRRGCHILSIIPSLSPHILQPVSDKKWNSGYPSDPATKAWLDENFVDEVFGYPDVVRFSWAPIRDRLEKGRVKVVWQEDEEEDESSKFTQSTIQFGGQAAEKPRLGGYRVHKGVKRACLS